MCVCEYYLEHWIREERLQHSSLAGGVGLVLLQQLVEVSVLLTVCQNLQTVLMVSHKLLVNVQHRQQDVEQVRWASGRKTHSQGWKVTKYFYSSTTQLKFLNAATPELVFSKGSLVLHLNAAVERNCGTVLSLISFVSGSSVYLRLKDMRKKAVTHLFLLYLED